MQGTLSVRRLLGIGALAGTLLAQAKPARGQSPEQPQKLDLAAAGALLQQLQAQVQELRAQVQDLKAQEVSEKEESAELRKELEATKSQLATLAAPANTIPPGPAIAGPGTTAATTEE